jgi:hypothetical protein
MAVAEPKVGDDLLRGVPAIAKEIGQSVRQTYWQLETGVLPGGKIGQTWVGSRQTLRKFFQELTATRQPHGKTGNSLKTNKTNTTSKIETRKAVSA